MIILKTYNIYTKNKLEQIGLTLTSKYIMKIFKKKSQTSKLFDEWTFLSPACAWVNKQPKNKVKANEAGR